MFWIDKLRKAYKIKEIQRGYQYAIEILSKQNSDDLLYLETMVSTAKTFNDFGYFDQGIENAISDYKCY